MTRKCSHCSNNGHNSRTCPNRGGVRIFGVRLTDGSIKKSASMGCLSSVHHLSSSSSTAGSPNNPSSSSNEPLGDPAPVGHGYVSDDAAQASCSSNCRGERKKGVPWTEEEHRMFLMGLQKLGKGDWRGIARNYVMSRTPTQVASHAQKFFIRQTNGSRRKRRSSLFDMVPEMSQTHTRDAPLVPEEPLELPSSQPLETETENQLPLLNLSLNSESEPMKTTSITNPEEAGKLATPGQDFQVIIPAFVPAYVPIPYPFWSLNSTPAKDLKIGRISHHQVLKPTPIHSRNTVNVDELVGMSKLNLVESAVRRHLEPSPLSLSPMGAPSRQSAFHANPSPVSRSSLRKGSSSAIHAV